MDAAGDEELQAAELEKTAHQVKCGPIAIIREVNAFFEKACRATKTSLGIRRMGAEFVAQPQRLFQEWCPLRTLMVVG